MEKEITIRWFGQSFFLITSSQGKRVAIDPFGDIGFTMPEVEADVVAVTHEHKDHNNVSLIKGNPEIFHGLTEEGKEYNQVDQRLEDVRIYSVPAYHDNQRGAERGKNAVFVVETDELRLAHLGDLGHRLQPEQLEKMGKIDILIVPVGGRFTVDAQEASEIIDQLNPRVVIPIHFKTSNRPQWPGEDEAAFLQGRVDVKRMDSNTLKISKATLPQKQATVVLQYE
jgi:L-ascorbate metabolism protein UlaG (beta-lactamase superfamily)